MTKVQEKSVASRIRGLRQRSGLTVEEAAKAAGFRGASSFQHYTDRFVGTFLPLDVAERLCKAFVGKGEPPITRDEIMALTGLGPNTRIDEKSKLPVATIPIIGEAAAGRWLEVDEGMESFAEQHLNVAPDATYSHCKQFALKVVGNSMNAAEPRPLPDGCYAICVDWADWGGEPKTGDIVAVQRTRLGGHLVEVTIKQIEIQPDGRILLWPRSTERRWSRPVAYDDGGEESEVVIFGLVIAKHEPLR